MNEYLVNRIFNKSAAFSPGSYLVPEGDGLVISGSDFIIDGNSACLVSQFVKQKPLPVNKKVFTAGGLIVAGTHSLRSKKIIPNKVILNSENKKTSCDVKLRYLGNIELLSFFIKEHESDQIRRVEDFSQIEDGDFPQYSGIIDLEGIRNNFSFVLQVEMDKESIIVDEITVTTAGGKILWEADPDTHLGNCYNIGFSIYDPASPLEFKGTAITMENCHNVVVRNFSTKGFFTGLIMKNCENCTIESNDFSENYNDQEYGWGDGVVEYGGIVLEDSHANTILQNRAENVWNGLVLTRSNGNTISNNIMRHCANVCLKMSNSCDNEIENNDFSWGLRIYPGEVHARDSVSCLIENGSNRNRVFQNDFSHGGDGIFIRVLNHWCSVDNSFIENDCSHANNNAIEAWSPANYYKDNNASFSSYGFWLGGSDETVLLNNIVHGNGGDFQNAPEHFGNAGIAVVNGSAEGMIVLGNELYNNHGPAFALGCDDPMRTAHWLIADNKILSTLHDKRGYQGNVFYLYNSKYIDIMHNSLRKVAGSELVIGNKGTCIDYKNHTSDIEEAVPFKPVISGRSFWIQGETIKLTVQGAGENPRWYVDGKKYPGPEAQFTLREPRFYRAYFHAHNQLSWFNFFVLPSGSPISVKALHERNGNRFVRKTGISIQNAFFCSESNSSQITIDLQWEKVISFTKKAFGIFVLFNHEAEVDENGRQLKFVFHSEKGDASFSAQYPSKDGFVTSDQRYKASYFSFLGNKSNRPISMDAGFDPTLVLGVSITAEAAEPGMGELHLDYPVVCADPEDEQ
jgi:parallel beta-helix repeat protein